jgi:hypothetical protein
MQNMFKLQKRLLIVIMVNFTIWLRWSKIDKLSKTVWHYDSEQFKHLSG